MANVRFATPPLTVRECATFMGRSPEWIRHAIQHGQPVHGRLVRLEAETIKPRLRTTYRIHEHQFAAFLQAIGWKHLPRAGTVPHAYPQRLEA